VGRITDKHEPCGRRGLVTYLLRGAPIRNLFWYNWGAVHFF